MSGKEFFKETMSRFFVVVTLVSVAIGVLGSIFQPEQ